jgi:hypothetical protein
LIVSGTVRLAAVEAWEVELIGAALDAVIGRPDGRPTERRHDAN